MRHFFAEYFIIIWTARYFSVLFPTLSYIPKNLEHSLFKSHSTRRRLKFLKDCFAEQVLPKSFLPARLRHLSNTPFDEFAALILKKHIQETKIDEKTSFKKLNNSKRNFFCQIPTDWRNTLLNKIYFNVKKRLRLLDGNLTRKISKLINDSPWTKKYYDKCCTQLIIP